uniref:cAMP-independent regulatory protein pac2 n=1 Tax=Mycena chlorophos TaxID=658473 RepID=A0ABQ0LNR5_MYCCL|nr:predicted protein [Mycena chlorophos]
MVWDQWPPGLRPTARSAINFTVLAAIAREFSVWASLGTLAPRGSSIRKAAPAVDYTRIAASHQFCTKQTRERVRPGRILTILASETSLRAVECELFTDIPYSRPRYPRGGKTTHSDRGQKSKLATREHTDARTAHFGRTLIDGPDPGISASSRFKRNNLEFRSKARQAGFGERTPIAEQLDPRTNPALCPDYSESTIPRARRSQSSRPETTRQRLGHGPTPLLKRAFFPPPDDRPTRPVRRVSRSQMAFRPGLQEPQLGPYVTHPSLHIRDVADAHKVLEAVRLNLLPLIRRRLLAHERAQLRSGNVFVWEECEDVDDGGLVRWTEGRRWSQSRMRGDYLFYEEKVQTTYQEKQAKAARRATRASDPGAVLPPPPKRKDRPAKEDGLTKQTYSVSVRLPGPGGMVATRKWHIVAYFSAADFALLPVVEHYEYLRNIRVPDGIFISSRVPCGRQRFPSNRSHSDDAESASQSGASRSPTTPSFELSSPDVDFFAVPLNQHQNPRPYLLPPPQAGGGPGAIPRMSLPPLASLGYPSPPLRPVMGHRHSSPTARSSSEDRRILDRLRPPTNGSVSKTKLHFRRCNSPSLNRPNTGVAGPRGVLTPFNGIRTKAGRVYPTSVAAFPRHPTSISTVIMKEILYIQAGPRANYAGTHFWNTQDSYLADDTATSDAEEPEVDHTVSFREGLNAKGESMYSPRLLLFDHKANFGSLGQSSALYAPDQDDADSVLQNLSWFDNTVAYRQSPLAPSRYQTEMDLEEASSGNTAASHPQIGDVRFWSDFNRMYYLPRTVQKVPDVAEWEIEHGAANWALGHETFLRYDEGTGLMEGPARGFLEECDSIQGVQLTHDTTHFGSFINSFLIALRDEAGKIPTITFPLLSERNAVAEPENRLAWRKTLNDALALRGLSELATLNIPVQPPSHWHGCVFQNEFIYADPTHPYHSSAVLSAHIESVTLPFRLNRSQETILDVASQLCDSAAPIVELSGAFPLPLRSPANPAEARLDLDGRIWNFSALRGTGTEAEPQRPSLTIPNNFWRRNVTRGILSSQKPAFELYFGGSERLPDAEAAALVNCTHGLAYPLPTSFPAFFRADQERTPPSAALFSSLGTTSATSRLLQSYLDLLDRKSKGFNSFTLQAASDIGVEADDVVQLVADFWDLRERYPSDQQEDNIESDIEVAAEEWE